MEGSMRDFMNTPIDKYYLDALKKYYIASEDRRSKVVDFTHNQMSPLLSGSEEITEDNANFVIIDSFNGIKPVVLDYDFLTKGEKYVPILAGIALDSQVVHYLHRFVTDQDGKFQSTTRGVCTRKLLQRIASYSKKGWDFNAFFYLAEAMSNNLSRGIFPHEHASGMSILRLQTMDDDVFIRRGEIVPDPDKLDEYAERHHRASFDAVSAKIIATTISAGMLDGYKTQVLASYSALLKIGLLQYERCDTHTKLRRLFEFFHAQLGVFGLREAVVACLHFSGKSGKFIPIEKGARNVRQKLLASAWDLQLLRLPENIIANESLDHTSVYYVCTADKTLQRLGRMFAVHRVSSIESRDGHLPSAVSLRTDLIEEEVGEALTKTFDAECSQSMSRSGERSPKNFQQISAVVTKLEHQVIQLTKN